MTPYGAGRLPAPFLEPFMYRCVLYLRDGRTVAAATRQTWDEADADLAARMTTDAYTGGHIEALVDGIGWALCNDRPDDEPESD